MPNGGIPVDDYIYEKGSFNDLLKINNSLIDLLQNGIIKMNEKNVYHCDIKDSNILVDASASAKTRLIDWGLSVEYTPFKDHPFPSSWKNRPFQYNVPFSVILFSDRFVEKYTRFLENGGNPNKIELKPFVIDYVAEWMKERGAGHYKFINEVMFELFSHSITSLSEKSKPQIVETQITMNYIINYLVDVLINFTKHGKNVKQNLRDYLDNVFIKIVDIWGFISVYFTFIEILFNNYANLTPQELEIFNKLQYIFVEYLYNPRHTIIDVNVLYADLKDLNNLIRNKLGKNVRKSKRNVAKSSNIENFARGVKTRRNTFSFKRRPNQRRFKKPFLLSLK
jgi:serine/threonine protein kinase